MRPDLSILGIVLLLAACNGDKEPVETDPTPPTTDTDAPTGDTDPPTADTDPQPDCPAWYPDADADTYGDLSATPIIDCVQPANHVENALDCDDSDATVNPDGAEVCDPADVDEDCSGLADDADASATGQVPAWPDVDGDGHGDPTGATADYCDPPVGWAASADDCDDNDFFAYPGAAFVEDPTACMLDLDGDGWGSDVATGDVVPGTDCDDAAATVAPDAPELFGDYADQDCDGEDFWIVEDDFELGVANPAVFATATGELTYDSTYVVSGIWSAKLSAFGSTLGTITIDASLCTGLEWSYQGKRGPEQPDAGEFLTVQYHDGVKWVDADAWEGSGAVDAAFSERSGLLLAPGALHATSAVRLIASGGSTGLDYFFVDDFTLACNGADADADGVPERYDCDDTDAAHWSDCGSCTDADADDFGAGCDLGEDCDDTDGAIYPTAPDPKDGFDQNCDTIDGPVLADTFELGALDPLVWSTTTGNAAVSTELAAHGSYALNVWGSVNEVVTNTLDTTTCSEVAWAYQGKRGPDQPDDLENLELWYDAGAGWVSVHVLPGIGVTDPTFTEYSGAITDPAALSSALRMRFTWDNSSSGEGFFIDDFIFGCPDDNDGDGLLDCDDTDPLHTYDCDICVDADGDGYGELCDGGGDCDDTDSTINPAAFDKEGDGVDRNCDTLDGSGIIDDFESGGPSVFTWDTVAGSVAGDTTYVANGTTSLALWGADGLIESYPLDASLCTSVVWQYLGKRGGAEQPDAGDFVELQYWDGAAWILTDAWEGGATDAAFSIRNGVITDKGALHSDFKIRFLSLGATGTSDYFYIDDVLAVCGGADADGDGFPGDLDCDDSEPLHWSDCGLCLDNDGDGYGPDCDLGSDCNDTNAAIRPGAADTLVDGLDQNCNLIDGAGLYDGFEFAMPSPAVWSSVTGDALVDTVAVAKGAFSLTLSGGGAIAETVALDTTTCPEVIWTYTGKRGPEQPDAGETLTVSWSDGAAWTVSDVWEGTGSIDADFSVRYGVITDPAALTAAFRLELDRAGGSSGVDDFHVDEFAVGCSVPDLDGDGIPGSLDCDDADPLHWGDCGLCTDADADGFGTGCDRGTDCDDADPSVSPDAADLLGDGMDTDCNGFDGPGLVDDFESGFNSQIWLTQSDAAYVTTKAWSGTTSLELGAAGVAETVDIDLSTCAAVFWSYYGLREGADVGETLTFSWFDGAAWVAADNLDGTGITDVGFSHRWGVITDPAALSPDFSAEFLADSSGEDWFVDDLTIACDLGDADGDGLPLNIDCDDSDAWHWSDCGLCVDVDFDGYGIDCDLGSDCDDADGAVNPAAIDQILDGFDNDCDTLDYAALYDDFEAGVSSMFPSLVGEATIVDSLVACPANPAGCGMVLRLSGDSTATSLTIDSTVCTTIGWAYEGRRGPEDPDSADTLNVEWDAGAGWTNVDTWVGNGDPDPTFLTRSGMITDPLAFSPTLKMRLVSDGAANSDHWYVDDVRIGCID